MQVTLDASGAMLPASVTDPVFRNAYTPYGAVRGADNLTISMGWLNKIADTDTGLTYLGARYYDPLTSRFISPDPLMNPMNPKTLDAFMYANNNPVSFSDPTGLTPYYQGNTKVLDEYYADGSYLKTRLSMTPTNDVTSAWIRKDAAEKKKVRDDKLAAIAAQEEADKKWIAEQGKFSWGDAVNVGFHGAVNFGGGFVNGVTGAVNGVTGLVGIPKIGAIPIWGDYDTYKYSSWAGGACGVAATMIVPGGAGAGALKAPILGGDAARVLYSGGPVAKAAAQAFAKLSGGTTIEMTAVGKILDTYGRFLPQTARTAAWTGASRAFASTGVRGSVANVFLRTGGFREYYRDIVYFNTELPALTQRGISVVEHFLP